MITRSAMTAASLFMAIGLGGQALAANCATVSVSPGTPSFPSWNPINPAIQEASVTATVTRVSSQTKSLRLIFLDANSNQTTVRVGTTSGPRYRVINSDTGSTISFPSGTQVGSSAAANVQFGGSSNVLAVNLKVQILANSAPSEDFIGGDQFTETLRYAVECYKNSGNGSGNPLGTDSDVASNLTVGLTIPKLATIVTGAPTTINFGNFTTTAQSAQISVKSTSTLNVSVSTSNSGKLVRGGAVAPYPDDSTIPYGMTFKGTPIAPGATLTNQARAGVLGSSYPLQLTLTNGIPSGKLAGTYSDTITLTITPGQ